MVSFKIGNGNKVRFLEDRWAGEISLKEQFPSLFRISTFSSRLISNFVDQTRLHSEGFISWNFHFSWNSLDKEIHQILALLQSLEGRHLSHNLEEFG